MEMEIWKDIEGYEDIYQVSNLGKIRNSNKELKQQDSRGYMLGSFSKNGVTKHKSIHRIVAKAFILNCENKPCVNHINGIKHDNRVENLEWVTHSENSLHSFANGLQLAKYGDNHHSSKVIESEFLNIFRLNQEGQSSIQIAKVYSVSKYTIQRILNKSRKVCKNIATDMSYIKRNAKQKIITEDMVKEVKLDLKNGMSGREIDIKYNISPTSVSNIKTGNNAQGMLHELLKAK